MNISKIENKYLKELLKEELIKMYKLYISTGEEEYSKKLLLMNLFWKN